MDGPGMGDGVAACPDAPCLDPEWLPPDDATLLATDPLFDAAWYCSRHPEAADDPVGHFLTVGADLGYDPSAAFSTNRYFVMHPDVAIARMNPLVHFLRHGREEGRLVSASARADDTAPIPMPLPRRSDRPCILVVGHLAGEQLFGAERSLLDLLDAFARIEYSTVVVVPTTNAAYLDDVAARCTALHAMPVPLRSVGTAPDESVVDRFVDLIALYGVDAVHTNTIVPREPLLAARRAGIPAVVHAREIPHDDPDLCEWLGASADDLVASVLAEADHVIANSLATAASYPLVGATSVAPNVVDVRRFPLTADHDGPLRVGLVGSGHEKKGRREFFELARRMLPRVDCEFVLVGPTLEQAAVWQATEEVPANVRFAGYAAGPVAAMEGLDIVVNLSTCRDAFPRTVLEAMAAGLPVVAWARGGLVEQVVDGLTGFLVPFGELDQIAERVERLHGDAGLRRTMGLSGRRVVEERNSPRRLAECIRSSYGAILRTPEVRAQMATDIVVPIPTENRTHHVQPFYVGNRARFAFISGVRWLSPTRLVAASLLGRRLYLIDLDLAGRTGEITDALPTTMAGGQETIVDLVAASDADHIFTSNCENSSVTQYRVTGDRLEYVTAVDFPAADGGYCHGVGVIPNRPDLVAATMTTGMCGVHFASLVDGARPAVFREEGWRPSALMFRDDEVMAVVADRNTVSQSPFHRHHTKLSLVRVDLTGGPHAVLDELLLDAGARVDSCVFHDELLYLANQAHDQVMVFDTSGNRFRHLHDHDGFSFPHDVAVSDDGRWMAVANYGTNEIRVRPLAPPQTAGTDAAGPDAAITPPDASSASPAG